MLNKEEAKFVLFFFSFFLLVLWVFSISMKDTNFDVGCRFPLEQAARETNADSLKQNLKTALEYMEERKMTSGYTSLVWKDSSESVGRWYKNVREYFSSISSVEDGNDFTEKTASREMKKKILEIPRGISKFPMNIPIAFLGFFLSCSTLTLGIAAFKK